MLQLILNLMYLGISGFFGIFGPIGAPLWFFGLIGSMMKYIVIANYFVPLGAFVSVGLSCLGFHFFVSGIVIVLDLF